MLMPRNTKYRKSHRGRRTGMATRGNTIAFGSFALQAQEEAWLNSRQIESARIAMRSYIKRGGKVWIRVFPDKPVSKKPAETRMGSGKGATEFWVAVVKPGRVIFELDGVPEELAKEAMRRAAQKLPFAAKFITREAEITGTSAPQEPIAPRGIDGATQVSNLGPESASATTEGADG